MYKLAAAFALVASPALVALTGAPAGATGLQIEIEGEGANGTVTVDLFEDLAPKHVEQITAIAAAGQYDGVVFHRVIDGFMAQTGDVEHGRLGGDMRRAGTGGSDRPDLPAEFSDYNYDRGVVGMARAQDPDSANSQFFIMFAPGPFLNGQYTVVGQVTDGMDVVDAIKRGDGPNGAVIGQPDVMQKVTVTE
ncbi:peptidylprolyl isomerase [Ruegeria sp.]|uniref:peptidylprolyl isomerase n=1 Tax=Ruegeria sp. TaxID=1879320 RepID=UPI003C7AB550